MIRRNEDQFDSGGVIFKHTFLIGYDDFPVSNENFTENMIDTYVKDKALDFEWELKFLLMVKYLGYIGKNENDVWIKKENNENE